MSQSIARSVPFLLSKVLHRNYWYYCHAVASWQYTYMFLYPTHNTSLDYFWRLRSCLELKKITTFTEFMIIFCVHCILLFFLSLRCFWELDVWPASCDVLLFPKSYLNYTHIHNSIFFNFIEKMDDFCGSRFWVSNLIWSFNITRMYLFNLLMYLFLKL